MPVATSHVPFPQPAARDANDLPRTAPPVPAELQVMWPKALLDAPVEVAAEAFARSLHGYAKRLDPEKAKRFTLSVDTPLYDAIDSILLAAYGGVHPKHRVTDYHEFFVRRIGRGERVIDLGCGVSMLAISIIQRAGGGGEGGNGGVEVTGVDWSEANLRLAAKLAREKGVAQKLHLVMGDICEMRVPGTFDVVVLSNVLEHVTDRPARLRRWVEWYQPKRVLIRVPAFDRDYRVPLKKELGIDWRCDQTHETEYTQEQVESEMREAGLKIRELIVRWCEYWVFAEPA
jgi:SAM-dependent methyltransferase